MSIGNLVSPDLARMLRIILWAVLTGVVLVIAPAPINFIILFAWIYLLWRSARRRGKPEPAKSPWPARDELDWAGAPAKLAGIRPRTIVAIHVAIVFTIIVVADAIPCKEIDRVMSREITLPNTTMTLGEFAELRLIGPVHPLHFSLEPEDEKVVVRFPRNRMKLGEIITTIEAQTAFRRRIAKCGNESTVLWGSCIMYIVMQPDRQAGRNDSNRVVAQASDGEAAKPVPQGLSEMKKADVPLESVR
jgi:hypothetical protein